MLEHRNMSLYSERIRRIHFGISILVTVIIAPCVLEGCGRVQSTSTPTTAPALTHASPPQPGAAGIQWFNGPIENAFQAAQTSHKPLMVFWGAQWCPYCQALKTTVFTRPDFIERSKLFIPVYLDGDLPEAQQWGDQLRVRGYPTVVILRPDRTEIARLSGGLDLTQYGGLLDDALQDERPAKDLLNATAKATDPNPSTSDCHRLAYESWDLDAEEPGVQATLTAPLTAASERCGPETVEGARLELWSLQFNLAAYTDQLKAHHTIDQGARQQISKLQAILADPHRVAGVIDLLYSFDDRLFSIVAREDPVAVDTFRTTWVSTLMAASKDTRFGPAERLMSLAGALEAEKDLRSDGHSIPDDMQQSARRTVDAALASPRDKYARGDIVHAAVGVYETLGDNRAAYDLLVRELPNSKTPYYYMSYLADIDETEGHPEKALGWSEKAYESAEGPATKIQWGEIYVRGLIRLAPNDNARIREIALQVASDAAAPQALHARTRARVDHMTQALEQWATNPERQQILAAVRDRIPHA